MKKNHRSMQKEDGEVVVVRTNRSNVSREKRMATDEEMVKRAKMMVVVGGRWISGQDDG
jgi:hypothetical protein